MGTPIPGTKPETVRESLPSFHYRLLSNCLAEMRQWGRFFLSLRYRSESARGQVSQGDCPPDSNWGLVLSRGDCPRDSPVTHNPGDSNGGWGEPPA